MMSCNWEQKTDCILHIVIYGREDSKATDYSGNGRTDGALLQMKLYGAFMDHAGMYKRGCAWNDFCGGAWLLVLF